MPEEDNRIEWRKRYDDMAAQETPLHPDCTGGEVEWVNGPKGPRRYAIGSVEWRQEQMRYGVTVTTGRF